MRDATDQLAPISFTYEYAGHGWARAYLSDGQTRYFMDPSYVPTDPLVALVHAMVELLRHGGEVMCSWFYEPAEDRWILRRDGDALHITIRGVRDGFSRPNWPLERGELRFSTTCDLWKFAAKVRLAASRMESAGEEYHDPSAVQSTPQYRAICSCLEEHKREGQPPSRKKRAR